MRTPSSCRHAAQVTTPTHSRRLPAQQILAHANDKIGGAQRPQSVNSASPSSSTSLALDPSALAASVRKTARPGPDRQIEVVSVSPGNTGEVKRAVMAEIR